MFRVVLGVNQFSKHIFYGFHAYFCFCKQTFWHLMPLKMPKWIVASKSMHILCTDPSCQNRFILTVHCSSSRQIKRLKSSFGSLNLYKKYTISGHFSFFSYHFGIVHGVIKEHSLKGFREMLSQQLHYMYTLYIYPSAHNQLRRHLPNPFLDFPCSTPVSRLY